MAKVLARAGVASRREIERLIEAGRVTVNGATLTSPGVRIGPKDILTVDGAIVAAPEPARLFRYHKPVGLVTTHSDPKGRKTVFQTLPAGLPRLISVGRLDITSEGLLLLTNDGELARALELPSGGWLRRYRARARGRIYQARLDRLKDGLTVEGVRYGPIEASLDPAREGPAHANIWLTLTLAEGKNREVRRVLEALGLAVNRLIRIAYGPFALADLEPGAVLEVSPREIREHLTHVIAPANLPAGECALYEPPATKSASPHRARPEPKRGPRAPPADPPRKTYKAGWAKPKPRSRAKRGGLGQADSPNFAGRPRNTSPRGRGRGP